MAEELAEHWDRPSCSTDLAMDCEPSVDYDVHSEPVTQPKVKVNEFSEMDQVLDLLANCWLDAKNCGWQPRARNRDIAFLASCFDGVVVDDEDSFVPKPSFVQPPPESVNKESIDLDAMLSTPESAEESSPSKKQPVPEVPNLALFRKLAEGDLDEPLTLKQEQLILNRIRELKREGCWSEAVLPKCAEPPRKKTYWDNFLAEMHWLSKDFCAEHKSKKAKAKKFSLAVSKIALAYYQLPETRMADELKLQRRVGLAVSRSVRQIWQQVEKTVAYRNDAIVQIKRERALSAHLNIILGEAENGVANDAPSVGAGDRKDGSSLRPYRQGVLQDQERPDQLGDDYSAKPSLDDDDDDDDYSSEESSSCESGDEASESVQSEQGSQKPADHWIDYEKLDSGDSKERQDQLTSIAEAVEKFQPKGFTLESTQVRTPVPFLLKHALREYQHVGLDWLVTLNEKGLNGILADEMGLGKTIQTIALLAHMACEKCDWGPHLIIVPTSVLLNWEMEFKKWCPAFKILTYYGHLKERKEKRRGWYKEDNFHVCITSYKLVVQDLTTFRRRKWHYMILDEAQNIKNFKSMRWQVLLKFKADRRLLLTGTPLQNSLMELWSLMHFLMPNVFRSHHDFKEWFNNPLVSMIEGTVQFNEQLVKRLHGVLRPFLLRRLKHDVEKQLPKKYEHVVACQLSKRQRYLYNEFMSRGHTRTQLATGSVFSVIGILMQLRKVCNHPNLFEPRPVVSPFVMPALVMRFPGICRDLNVGPGSKVPDWLISYNRRRLIKTTCCTKQMASLKYILDQIKASGSRVRLLLPCPSAASAKSVSIRLCSPTQPQQVKGKLLIPKLSQPGPPIICNISSSMANSISGVHQRKDIVLRLLRPNFVDESPTPAQPSTSSTAFAQNHDSSDGQATMPCLSPVQTATDTLAEPTTQDQMDVDEEMSDAELDLSSENEFVPLHSIADVPFKVTNPLLDVFNQHASDEDAPSLQSLCKVKEEKEAMAEHLNLVNSYRMSLNHGCSIGSVEAFDLFNERKTPMLARLQMVAKWQYIRQRATVYVPAVCTSCVDEVDTGRQCYEEYQEKERIKALELTMHEPLKPYRQFLLNRALVFPEIRLIEYDCGKLHVLANMLRRLQAEGHRCLIFTQMTKMLDILEIFLSHHGYKYLRLDGATGVDRRQMLMERFNDDRRILCFILSTRSGGLGINLTGADTVIFYDSDWNPTMDAQAQDRCHRIGQTRDVHIYRLICEKTIEENILLKANQKRALGMMAIESGAFNPCLLRETIRDLFKTDNNAISLTIEQRDISTADMQKAMASVEDDTDVLAAKAASAEAAFDKEDFEEVENKASTSADSMVEEDPDICRVDQSMKEILDELRPVERFCLKYLSHVRQGDLHGELEEAEKEVEEHRKVFKETRRKEELREKERRDMLMEEDFQLTYDGKDQFVKIYSVDDLDMPIWDPIKVFCLDDNFYDEEEWSQDFKRLPLTDVPAYSVHTDEEMPFRSYETSSESSNGLNSSPSALSSKRRNAAHSTGTNYMYEIYQKWLKKELSKFGIMEADSMDEMTVQDGIDVVLLYCVQKCQYGTSAEFRFRNQNFNWDLISETISKLIYCSWSPRYWRNRWEEVLVNCLGQSCVEQLKQTGSPFPKAGQLPKLLSSEGVVIPESIVLPSLEVAYSCDADLHNYLYTTAEKNFENGFPDGMMDFESLNMDKIIADYMENVYDGNFSVDEKAKFEAEFFASPKDRDRSEQYVIPKNIVQQDDDKKSLKVADMTYESVISMLSLPNYLVTSGSLSTSGHLTPTHSFASSVSSVASRLVDLTVPGKPNPVVCVSSTSSTRQYLMSSPRMSGNSHRGAPAGSVLQFSSPYGNMFNQSRSTSSTGRLPLMATPVLSQSPPHITSASRSSGSTCTTIPSYIQSHSNPRLRFSTGRNTSSSSPIRISANNLFDTHSRPSGSSSPRPISIRAYRPGTLTPPLQSIGETRFVGFHTPRHSSSSYDTLSKGNRPYEAQ